ncbi:MAG: hypothetical protein KAU20_07790, partial [Nanoarchaeota archaeon]|nr:hypothetical protein [Nanoarchaeota archaeon]
MMTSSLMGADLLATSAGVFALGAIVPTIPGVAYSLPLQDARNVFTKMLVAVYKEKTSPTSFLRSFFPVTTTMSKEIAIQVQRGTEFVAVDVERGTNGNRNTFNTSTEKIFVPPFYWEYLTANEHRLY